MSMNLERLREEIARAMMLELEEQRIAFDDFSEPFFPGKAADRILAIPSIATALRFTDLHRSAGVVVGDPKLSSPE